MKIMNGQLAKQKGKLICTKSFGEKICDLHSRINGAGNNFFGLNSFTDEIAVHLDMFCSFVKHRIVSNVSSNRIVTNQRSWLRRRVPNSLNNHLTQRTSLTIEAMDRYSASADERETTDCFFVFQEMGAPPKRSKYRVRDFRV